IHNVLTKCLGTSNPHNVIRATVDALQNLVAPEEMAARRGKGVEDLGHHLP
ncbi:MAG: 30S ribosomal protein S5, partial [Myxococcales bacterium]|nr:30S ribosomal protein S5 [Myxococcales bacterium]